MIVGLIGKARVGKDTVADYLKQHYLFQQYAFADPFKTMLESVFGDKFRSGDREAVIPWLGKSPRQLMQTLGTEWGRELIHPQIWTLLGQKQVLLSKTQNQPLVISDVRHHDEADMILAEGGELWHIIRDTTEQVNPHSSEEFQWDMYDRKIINNTGSLEDLYETVEVAYSGPKYLDLMQRVKSFSKQTNPKLCRCDHKLQYTGAVFYQSMQILECSICNGWQDIRKPIK